jgi:hypothetical protein
MTSWRRWKRGAQMCAVFAFFAFLSLGIAVPLVGVFVILPVELISGSSAIEEFLKPAVLAVAALIFPVYVDLAIERCTEDYASS